VRFERLLSIGADAPGCPGCGGATQKVPGGISLGGQASAGTSKEQMPQTWRGLHNGDREYVTHMQRTWEQRQKLEARHPDLAGDQRPVLAHEGRYHEQPLRAGDLPVGGRTDTGGSGGHRGSGTGGGGSGDDGAGVSTGSVPTGHDHRLGAKSAQSCSISGQDGDQGRGSRAGATRAAGAVGAAQAGGTGHAGGAS